MSDHVLDEWRAKLRTRILETLNRVSGHMLDEWILFADTNMKIVPRSELTDFRNELAMLETMGLIVAVRAGPLDSHRKIRITAAGRAALAEQQQ